MKKTFLLICLAAGLLSCTKELTPQEETPAGVPMNFEITVTGTKASKTDWEKGDDIVLFFKGIEDNFILFSYNEETQGWDVGISNDTYTSSDFENLEEYLLTAVYLPGISSLNIEDGYFDFFGIDEEHIFNYYLAKTGVPYTVDGTTVRASFSLEKPENFVQFHVAGIENTVGKYTFASPQVRPVALTGVNFDGTLREEEQQAGARLSGFADADGAIFAGRLVNPEATAYTFTLASDDKIYSLERSSALTAGKMYNFPVLSDSRWTETAASDLYVDLGLTSGVKWAKCNLGAAVETDYGDYFAWGETVAKSDFSWGNYRWMQEGEDDWIYINKYTHADGRTMGIWYDGETFIGDGMISLQEDGNVDDAAYAALGGKFRMPTDDEWTELRTSCTWTYKTTDDGYASKGYLVTGPNEKTIFLPLAGCIESEGPANVGKLGYYWSSSYYEQISAHARSLYLIPNTTIEVRRFGNERYSGLPIRPVYAK
jgi:hypothetical protein